MRDTAFRCCIWHRFSCAWWRRLCARAISGLLHAPVLRASRWFFARAAYCVRIGRSLLLGLPLSGKLSSKCTLVFFGWQDIAEMHDFEQAWGAFAFAVVLFSQLAVLEKERCAVRAQKNSAFRPLICQRSKRSVHFALFLPSACWCATVCADQAARGGVASLPRPPARRLAVVCQ